jgi:propanol-preferring alcohol dehydrogenase
MQAQALCECGKPLRHIERRTPEPVGTEVLLEVMYCGVCHTDIHLWEGFYDLGSGKRLTLQDRGIDLPLTLGHEILGRVVKYGEDAQGVSVGDVRIVYPWIGCGECRNCRTGQEHMCSRKMRSLGIFYDGGYGSHVVAPDPRYLVDPGRVPHALAATLACSGVTVYAAVEKVMPLEADEPAVVVGAGGLGLTAIDLLKAMGHRNIVAVDISAEKRQAALDVGATHAVDGSADKVTDLILCACGGPVRAILDFVNGSKSARFSIDALTKGGKLVQVGLFGGDITLALPMMTMKALTLQGSYIGSVAELRKLIGIVERGVMGSLPIEEVPQEDAYEALMRLKSGKVRGRIVLRSDAV